MAERTSFTMDVFALNSAQIWPRYRGLKSGILGFLSANNYRSSLKTLQALFSTRSKNHRFKTCRTGSGEVSLFNSNLFHLQWKSMDLVVCSSAIPVYKQWVLVFGEISVGIPQNNISLGSHIQCFQRIMNFEKPALISMFMYSLDV